MSSALAGTLATRYQWVETIVEAALEGSRDKFIQALVLENPALNFAAEGANELGLPLVVYQGLRPDYPWASDRFHTFILESAADMAADLADRGIPYGFHLERRRRQAGEPRPESPLEQLAGRAAFVVTDYFPTFIVPRQTRRLRERADPR